MASESRPYRSTLWLTAAGGLLVVITSIVMAQQPTDDANKQERQTTTEAQRPETLSEDKTPNPDSAERQATRQEDSRAAAENRKQAEGRTEDKATTRTPERQDARRADARAEGSDTTRARNRLGIEFGQQTEGGMTIANVAESSRAAQAGLRVGDRVVSVDGRRLTNPRQLEAYLGGLSDRNVPIVIDRGGRLYTVHLRPNPSAGEGAWLGVYLQDNENETGATVTGVYPSGPAARAGIRTGDVIVAANGQKIGNTPDLIATIDELDPQSRAELVVLRGGQEVTFPVVLGRRDSFVANYRGFDERADMGRENDFNSDLENFPPFAMQLEHDRRNAEQHQRIETEIKKLQEEVRKLRELIEQRK